MIQTPLRTCIGGWRKFHPESVYFFTVFLAVVKKALFTSTFIPWLLNSLNFLSCSSELRKRYILRLLLMSFLSKPYKIFRISQSKQSWLNFDLHLFLTPSQPWPIKSSSSSLNSSVQMWLPVHPCDLFLINNRNMTNSVKLQYGNSAEKQFCCVE